MFISRKEIKRFGVKRKQRRNKIQYNSFKGEWNDIYEQISNGIKIRRRCNWYELAKKSIKYFLNLQKSQGCQNILCKICSETQEITDTTRKTIFSFSRRPEKMVFPRKWRWNIIFLLLSGNMIFSVYTYGCYKYGATPLYQKKSKMILSRKIHLKVIDVLDWHSAIELQQYYMLSWRPLQAFSCIALQRKKTGNLIYRIEVWFLLQLIRL